MAEKQEEAARPGLTTRMLETVERVGNKLPDPAVLFIALLFIVWVLSWILSYVTFGVIDPRSNEPLVINNLLAPRAITEFLSVMVTNFSHFHPVGVVLVALIMVAVMAASMSTAVLATGSNDPPIVHPSVLKKRKAHVASPGSAGAP